MNRIFVEKKAAHNAGARHLLHDLRESLGLPGLQNVRVIQRQLLVARVCQRV